MLPVSCMRKQVCVIEMTKMFDLMMKTNAFKA